LAARALPDKRIRYKAVIVFMFVPLLVRFARCLFLCRGSLHRKWDHEHGVLGTEALLNQ
jgi:hypothetical protein